MFGFLRAPARPMRCATTLSQRKVAPATIAAFALPRIQVSFFGFDAVTRGLTRLRRRRDRCKAHAIGCWYGAAYLQRVMRCPQLLSGHRQGCQVLRCWRTPHSRSQANCPRPRCICRCEERLCIRSALERSLTPWAPRSDLHHRSGEAPLSVCVGVNTHFSLEKGKFLLGKFSFTEANF